MAIGRVSQDERIEARGAGLTPAEIETFRRDGLVVPAYRLSEALLARTRDAATRLTAARPDIRPEFIPLPHMPWDDGEDTRRLAGAFLDVALTPEFLDLVEGLLGPDIVFWTAALFCKPSSEGREIPWHQDGVYWPLDPPATVTLWLALDDSTRANGCLRYVPGSHKTGLLPHSESDRDGLVLNTAIAEDAVDRDAVQCVELEAGQVSVHDIYLIHGSEPNTSPMRRAGLTLRYMPATSHYDRARPMGAGSNTAPLEFATRPIWLARGTDRSGRNDFTIGH